MGWICVHFCCCPLKPRQGPGTECESTHSWRVEWMNEWAVFSPRQPPDLSLGPPWTTSLWSYTWKWSLAICSLSFCPPDLSVTICWCIWWHYPPLTNYLQTDPNGYEKKGVQSSLTHLQRLPLLISPLDFPQDFQNSPVSLPLFILNSNVFFVSCYCLSRVSGSLTLTVTPKLDYIPNWSLLQQT